MPKVDLARAKLHLRIDADEEDALIEGWIVAAYLAIEGEIFRKVYESSVPEEDPTGVEVDEVINSAALFIIGHLNANREPVAPGQMAAIPLGVEWLLRPYKDTAGGF